MIEPFIERMKVVILKNNSTSWKQNERYSPRRINTPDITKQITDAGIEQMYIRFQHLHVTHTSWCM